MRRVDDGALVPYDCYGAVQIRPCGTMGPRRFLSWQAKQANARWDAVLLMANDGVEVCCALIDFIQEVELERLAVR